MLFQSGFKNGATVSLIDAIDEDLYYKLKNGIVGVHLGYLQDIIKPTRHSSEGIKTILPSPFWV